MVPKRSAPHDSFEPPVAWTRAGRRSLYGALVLLGGCFDIEAVDVPDQFVWQASNIGAVEQEGEEPIPYVASAAMIAADGQIELGFGIVEAQPNVTFGWRIREGACDEAGDLLTDSPGAFPTVTTDSNGEAGTSVLLNGSPSQNLTYSVEVFLGAVSSGVLIGCGLMVLR